MLASGRVRHASNLLELKLMLQLRRLFLLAEYEFRVLRLRVFMLGILSQMVIYVHFFSFCFEIFGFQLGSDMGSALGDLGGRTYDRSLFC